VRDYIPEFRLHDAVATERVTVRDLLCHQSGLPRHDRVWIPGKRTPSELLGVMRYLELSRDIRAVSFTLEGLETSADAARPYMIHEDRRLPAIRLPVSIMAAGAINTSIADVANWMRLHLGNGEFDGERLLPGALIGELHAPRVYYTSPGYSEFGEAHYGLGFRCQSYRGDRLVFHGGGLPGWGTPEGQLVLKPDNQPVYRLAPQHG
jgi:CubicO group peptidase (beta-lactamase class C family)